MKAFSHRAVRRALPCALLWLTTATQAHTQPRSSDAPGEPAPKPRLTKAPVLLEFVEAEYPEAEKAAGRAASVVFEVAIAADGSVDALRVVESGGEAFDAAASEAVKRFRFTPAELDGVPAPIRIRYTYEFQSRQQAPVTGALSGLVRERKTQAALEGVRVELEGAAPATTDASGRFTFEDVAPGAHTILLSRRDLRALQTVETFEAGKRLEAIYEIEQATPAAVADAGDADDLELFIVFPRWTKQVVSTEVKAEDAQRVAGTQGDVLKIVENLPGVSRAAAGSGQLVVWGAAPEDTRVALDGIDLPTLYHFGGFRSVVHGDLVRSVELLPGGYGASYGRGTGGLVRVDTRDQPVDRLHASAQVDVLDASAAAQGPLSKQVLASASFRKSHLAWALDNATSEDAGKFFPIPSYWDGSARVRYQHDSRSFVELGGLVSSDDVTRTISSLDPSERKSQTRSLDFQRVFVRYVREPGDGARVVLLPWVGRDERSLRADFSGTPTELRSESKMLGLRANYSSRLHPTVTGSVGLDLKFVSSELRRAGSISSPAREGDAAVFGQVPSDQINVDNWRATQGSAAPYVEADFAPLGDTLHVVAGLRVEPMFQSASKRIPGDGTSPEVGTSRADVTLEPRLSLRYAPSSRATLRLAWGRYHQPALPEDLSAVFGNPRLGPSQALQYLGGADVKFGKWLSLETTAFYTQSDGLAGRNPESSPLVAQALLDAGEGRAMGAQFLLRHELSHGFFGWIAYTISRSERKDPGNGQYRLFDYDQTHTLTALAAYDLGAGFDVGVRARFASGYPRTQVDGAYYDGRRAEYSPVLGPYNGIRVPAFMQFDARVAKRFRIAESELELYLDVLNLTNRDNAEEIVYSKDYSQRRYIVGLPLLPVFGARWSY